MSQYQNLQKISDSEENLEISYKNRRITPTDYEILHKLKNEKYFIILLDIFNGIKENTELFDSFQEKMMAILNDKMSTLIQENPNMTKNAAMNQFYDFYTPHRAQFFFRNSLNSLRSFGLIEKFEFEGKDIENSYQITLYGYDMMIMYLGDMYSDWYLIFYLLSNENNYKKMNLSFFFFKWFELNEKINQIKIDQALLLVVQKKTETIEQLIEVYFKYYVEMEKESKKSLEDHKQALITEINQRVQTLKDNELITFDGNKIKITDLAIKIYKQISDQFSTIITSLNEQKIIEVDEDEDTIEATANGKTLTKFILEEKRSDENSLFEINDQDMHERNPIVPIHLEMKRIEQNHKKDSDSVPITTFFDQLKSGNDFMQNILLFLFRPTSIMYFLVAIMVTLFFGILAIQIDGYEQLGIASLIISGSIIISLCILNDQKERRYFNPNLHQKN